jgi:hypothetical protein
MRISCWAGALLCASLTTSLAQAQYFAPATHSPLLPAPDACGPGFYCNGPCGCTYGPSYCLRPPFPPVNGVPPPPYWGGGGGGCGGRCGLCAQRGEGMPNIAAFPTHPYARSPRDYFMWTEAERERITRAQRPPFAP